MRNSVFILFLLISISVQAQFVFEYDQSIPVKVNDQNLKIPWAGGLNSVLYNSLDLNQDGTDDLVLFDRTANKISTFLVVNDQYKYAPQYESYFPSTLTNWIFLRDYNCDGKKDLFESVPQGIRLYKNITTGDFPEWEVAEEIVNTVGTGSVINLYVNGSDVPAIEDIDGDGDLDILTFGFSGSGGVQYHKNLSIERTGSCEIDFERETTTWGDFRECNCGVFAFGGEDCPPSGGRLQHQGGKSLMVYDRDNDGDMEVIVGEESCNTLYILENEGSSDAARMTVAEVLQADDRPALMNVFPAAFLEDVNFDGVKDLLVSLSLSFSITGNPSDFEKSNLSYINNGSNANPNFKFQTDAFLQGEMIDDGINTSAAFHDVDGDGDLDMLVTSHGLFHIGGQYASSIVLYENIGTKAFPSFKLANTDYLGFSLQRFINMKIQIVDFDADGKEDLVVNAGFPGGGTTVFYLINNSSVGFDFTGQQGQAINVRLLSTENPYFYDVDKDGDLDIISGNSNGNMKLYRNTGSASFPNFVLETEGFYGLKTSFTNRNVIPTVADLNGDGKDELITADDRGELIIYDDFTSKLDAPEEGVKNTYFNPITQTIVPFKLGIRSRLVAADLDNSGTPYLIVGTIQGGLQLLKNSDAKPPVFGSGEDLLSIFPNPSTKLGNIIEIGAKVPLTVAVYSILGHRIYENTEVSPSSPARIPSADLDVGMYIAVAFRDGKALDQKKFVIAK